MTINHYVKLTMADVTDMVKERLGMNDKAKMGDIEITDYPIPVAPKEPEDTDGVGDKKAVKTSALINKSNIVKVLKEGLKGANASNRFPKDAKNVCIEAMGDAIEAMNKKDAKLFEEIINTKGFDKFALLWQQYQTRIQNRL